MKAFFSTWIGCTIAAAIFGTVAGLVVSEVVTPKSIVTIQKPTTPVENSYHASANYKHKSDAVDIWIELAQEQSQHMLNDDL